MENLGIVLSGGGVKGVAHIGLIQALREQGIQPKYVAGTSAGALVGAMYAADRHAKDMIDFFKSTPLFSWYYYSTNKPGILDT
ncbi:MAG: patatin-like phospholipase family protein, partial [Bacteroidota bacterium]